MRLKAFVAALLLAVGIVKVLDVPFNPCWLLSPDSWWYHAMGCAKDAAGGGGSGAGQP